MKYIDAEKLIKAIEGKGLDCSFALKMERLDTLALIDSLQQEPPEVDLEKEVHRFFEDCIEVYEVPLYGKVKEGVISVDCYEITARHFYELGLNAKEESK